MHASCRWGRASSSSLELSRWSGSAPAAFPFPLVHAALAVIRPSVPSGAGWLRLSVFSSLLKDIVIIQTYGYKCRRVFRNGSGLCDHWFSSRVISCIQGSSWKHPQVGWVWISESVGSWAEYRTFSFATVLEMWLSFQFCSTASDFVGPGLAQCK